MDNLNLDMSIKNFIHYELNEVIGILILKIIGLLLMFNESSFIKINKSKIVKQIFHFYSQMSTDFSGNEFYSSI